MQICDLKEKIISFRNERNWEQFHSLKELLLGLNIETAELSQLFLFKEEKQIENVALNKIENEIADIYIYLNYLAHHFKIDLEKAVLDKIKLNGEKYPIEKFYNSNKKYNEI